jgi:hypothetical protein
MCWNSSVIDPPSASIIQGTLRRPLPRDLCDVLVDDVRVWLSRTGHKTGTVGQPLVLRADGSPVASEGDQVACDGAFALSTSRPDLGPVFSATELRLVDEATQSV